ncbi:MAG: S41 family peptidase, partial [Chitinophagaceae bacterium]
MSKLFAYMFSKKSFLFILLLVLGGSVFYVVQSSAKPEDPKSRYEKVLHLVGEMLQDGHFSPRTIDDRFSKDIFTKFLQSLDPDKIYFLEGDVAQLKKFETLLDDEIKGASLESFFVINELYKQRVTQSADLYRAILSKPFDYSVNEVYVEEEEKRVYPKNENEWKGAWRKKLKYYALERYTDLLEEQEKNKGKADFVVMTKDEMEKEAREKVLRQFDRMYERFRNRFKDDDRFHQYVNVITESMDPHTTYFPPIEKRSFDEQMRGSFFGIGASLTEEDGNIKIATIVNGSPAWKSGELSVGDYILKVGQGEELTSQDLNGFEVTDAVRLIRGKKGTVVRLTIRKVDGTIKVVSLVRDEIPLDETYAKSVVIESKEHFKIGFIYLPEFYADFDRPNQPRCAPDVANEINKLKAQQVDGIILDLRNNGGGSLWDVVQMVGFFIPDGPVVQVKSKDEQPTVLRDRDNGSVLWDGPLV